MPYADSLGFIGLQTRPPKFSLWGRPRSLNLIHLTSVPPTLADFSDALRAHESFRADALENKSVHAVLTTADVRSGRLNQSMGILFGLQHLPSGMTRERMEQLADAGIRSVTLAYAGETEYGTGYKGSGPLTDQGRRALEWMAEYGILLDISHLSNQTAVEALRFVDEEWLPIVPMASHSACAHVSPHPRNASDEVLELLFRTQGYFGMLLTTFYLVPQKELPQYWEVFRAHVKYACARCGSQNVGIGSDSNYLNMTEPEAQEHFRTMLRLFRATEDPEYGPYFPDRPMPVILGGNDTIGAVRSKLSPAIRRPLLDAITGENFCRYLERALPS